MLNCAQRTQNFGQFFTNIRNFGALFTGLGVPELTIYQVSWGGAEHTFVSKYVKFEDDYKRLKKYS